MTREERKQALDWFSNRSKAVTMPGAKRMYLLATEALSADGDTISRQDAIDALERFSLGETDVVKLVFRMGDYLKRLPSAQPRKGKWDTFLEDVDGLHWEIIRCSMCGATKPRKFFKSDDFETNFCPNCGAKMEVENKPNPMRGMEYDTDY